MIQLPFDLVERSPRNQNAPRIGQSFQPGCEIHTIAIDILAIDDEVAEIDANAEIKTFFTRQLCIVFLERELNIDRASDGIHNARELNQGSIAHKFDQPAIMSSDSWVDVVGPHGLQPIKGIRLIILHKAAIADDIGS